MKMFKVIYQFGGFLTKLYFLFLLLGLSILSQAQNPFVRNIYTADPSAHVWNDGRLYVYPSHDIAPPQGCDLMDKYHVFSTDDMVNWTDHGEIVESASVDWGRADGGFMWAPDCSYKNGTYYFYFPHPSGDDWNSTWKIGVATSSEPAANFEVQGYIEGLKPMIDPCVFVDDDGQAYLYYGGGNRCEAGKLKNNMMEIDGQMQQMLGLVDFHEATWVHKYHGVYYLSYSDNNSNDGNQLRYAVSNNPLGPWTYKGIYMEPTGSPTNHGSIVQYKNQWYAFYHNSLLSGHAWLRSICVDSLFYNQEGAIQLIQQTREHGSSYYDEALIVPGIIEMEDYNQGGQGTAFSDSDTSNNGNAYRKDEAVDVEMYSPGNYNIGWTGGGEWLEYTVNVLEAGTYDFEVQVASPIGTSSFHIEVNDENVSGSVSIPNTGGWQTYKTVTVRNIPLHKGTHFLRFFEETGGFNADKMTVIKSGFISAANDINVEKNRFNIFPNPAKEKVSVRVTGNSSAVYQFNICTMAGHIIKEFTGNTPDGKKNFELDLNGIKAGTYLLVIKSNEELFIQKLIVN